MERRDSRNKHHIEMLNSYSEYCKWRFEFLLSYCPLILIPGNPSWVDIEELIPQRFREFIHHAWICMQLGVVKAIGYMCPCFCTNEGIVPSVHNSGGCNQMVNSAFWSIPNLCRFTFWRSSRPDDNNSRT